MDFVIQVLPASDHASVSVHPKPSKTGNKLEPAVLSWRCVPMRTKTLAPRPPWTPHEPYDVATQEEAGKYLQKSFREDLPIILITAITQTGQIHSKPAALRQWAHSTTVLKRAGAKQ